MDDLQQIVEQVKILADTQRAMMDRQEQVFKLHEEKLSSLEGTVASSAQLLQTTTENLETTNEALLASLSDADAAVDDLAKITAALLLVKKDMSQDTGESERSGALQPMTP